MEIRVNGEAKELPDGTTVVGLITALKLKPEHVAVELNQAVVRRAEHATTALKPGDVVEIVTFVGGG